jgi:hypothetical protein
LTAVSTIGCRHDEEADDFAQRVDARRHFLDGRANVRPPTRRPWREPWGPARITTAPVTLDTSDKRTEWNATCRGRPSGHVSFWRLHVTR